MLIALDILLTITHLSLIFFNLLGWIWVRTRKLHFYSILLTTASWFGLGLWYGLGYCPVTDWQWQVKEKLGERNLPGSFIKYFADKITDPEISGEVINMVTLVAFLLAASLSVYVNFFKTRDHIRTTY